MSRDLALVLVIFVFLCLPIALLPILVVRLRGKRLEDATSLGARPSEWKQADRAQRRRVWRAVVRGETAITPEDAQLALVMIDWKLAQRRRMRLLTPISLAFSAFLVFGIILSIARGDGFSLVYLPFLALFAYGLFANRNIEERLKRSRSLNETLAALAPEARNDPIRYRTATGVNRSYW
jgi:hypothetical protein